MADDREIHQCLKCSKEIIGTIQYIEHHKNCEDIQWSYILNKIKNNDFDGAIRDMATEAQSAARRTTEAMEKYKATAPLDKNVEAVKATLSACDILGHVGYLANTAVQKGIKDCGTFGGNAGKKIAGFGATIAQMGHCISSAGKICVCVGDSVSGMTGDAKNLDVSSPFIKLGSIISSLGDTIEKYPELKPTGIVISSVGSLITLGGQAVTPVGYGISKLGEYLSKASVKLAEAAQNLIAESGASEENLRKWGLAVYIGIPGAAATGGAGAGAAIGGAIGVAVASGAALSAGTVSGGTAAAAGAATGAAVGAGTAAATGAATGAAVSAGTAAAAGAATGTAVSAGTAAATGAATGATAGTPLGPVGAAIGAGVGALVGAAVGGIILLAFHIRKKNAAKKAEETQAVSKILRAGTKKKK